VTRRQHKRRLYARLRIVVLIRGVMRDFRQRAQQIADAHFAASPLRIPTDSDLEAKIAAQIKALALRVGEIPAPWTVEGTLNGERRAVDMHDRNCKT
jgi:hypothetical protein